MSQYSSPSHNPYAAYNEVAEPRKTSGLAITALVMSLVGIIPCCGIITAPLGVILGLIGAVMINARSPVKGRGLAIAAVILGLLFTGLQIGGMYWGWNKMMAPVWEGPAPELRAGFAGDATAFKRGFTGRGATASDAEVQEFIETLRSRYGAFVACEFNPQSQRNAQPTPGQQQAVFPYRIQFANQTLDADAEMVFADNQGFVMKWSFIKVLDSTDGDVTYPPAATSSSAPSAPPSATPPSTPDATPPADTNGSPDNGE